MNRWEFSKSRSKYHFDPFVDEDHGESRPYRIVGKANNMQAAYECAVAERTGAPYSFIEKYKYITEKERMFFTEPYDMEEIKDLDLPANTVFFENLKFFNQSYLGKIQEVFQFEYEKFAVSFHTQKPGQLFPYHIDEVPTFKQNQINHEFDSDPKWVARFEIMVYDWVPGHVWAYGNTYWKQWKAGDIAWHNWRDIPHGTAN